MGQCGCGEGYDYRLKAPRGWYLIKVYPGCEDCDTPAGVHIDHETERHGFAEDLPDYSITDSCGQGMAILSMDGVRAALLNELGDTIVTVGGDTVADCCDFDELHKRIFRKAIDETLSEQRGRK